MSAASGGNSEPKQGQRSQSARGFCPRSTMRVPQPDIIEHFGNADAVPQLPERCLSRKAGIVRCCLKLYRSVLGWIASALCHARFVRHSAGVFFFHFQPQQSIRVFLRYVINKLAANAKAAVFRLDIRRQPNEI